MKISADWLQNPGGLRVMEMLAQGGHRSWFVGGCVRNAVLGAQATDVDIATDALPDRVADLATAAGLRAVPTGIEHGTVTVVVEGQGFEITTLRRDIETNGRHALVHFSDRIEEDAARRDFTMNALYATASGEVIDPLGQGLDDLRARHLRFIGEPADRIREDYLRILRFFRFHAWYGDPEGGIDAEGLAACAELSDGIDDLSRERIGAEMRKLLAAPDPAPAIAAMVRSGVMLRVMPGAGAHTLTVLVHVEEAAGLAPDWLRRLASLGGEDVVQALRLSNAEARRLDIFKTAIGSEAGAAETGYRLGVADGLDVLALRAAMMGQEIDPQARRDCDFGAAQRFPVSAADLMPEISGAELGRLLRQLEGEWIASGFADSRDTLLARVKNRA